MFRIFVKCASVTSIAVFSLVSCASTTVINSTPSGAMLYLDDQFVGTTPYIYSDTKLSGSRTKVEIEKKGYIPFSTTIVRNEKIEIEACIGGVLLLFPFFWINGYNPTHTYELKKQDNKTVSQ